jgi:8-oxo-dGTP diphosphatase
MSRPRYREATGVILIDTTGRLLLQHRDNIAGIAHPGKIGLFGGRREGGETFLQCAVREVNEELSYFVPPELFEHFASHSGADLEIKGGAVRGELFVARNIPVEALTITEGALLTVPPDELRQIEDRLTPMTRYALQAFGCLDADTNADDMQNAW